MAIEKAPETCVDHYVFWKVQRAGVQAEVKVKGQFDKEHYRVFLYHVEYLANPATKIRRDHEVEDIHHAKVHLLAYEISPDTAKDAPKEPMIVRNQFTGPEGHRWHLGRSRYLLIPARKHHFEDPPPMTPPPPRVDHFVCYDVLNGPPVVEPLVLRDQFATTDTHALKPVLFGVPVDKNGEGLLHAEVHLAIYELEPGLKLPAFPAVRTADQLRKFELNAMESVWLGVPSYKEWKR